MLMAEAAVYRTGRGARHSAVFTLAVLLAVSSAAFVAAGGSGESVEPIVAEEAWARATAGIPRNGAAYVRIANNSDVDEVLIGGESDVADVIEIHTHESDGGVMSMRPLPDGVTIPAGERAVLEPMGMHLMLIGLSGRLEAGESFPLELRFASGRTVEVEVRVRPLRE